MCVELCDAIGVGAFHFHLREVAVPLALGTALHCIKVPVGILCLKVFACIFYRHIRHAHLILHLLAGAEVKCEIHA